MGTDNLFHKRRKPKSKKGLSRKNPKRDPYEKILIVCEGEKTEPYYFREAKEYFKISSANIEICGDCGSDPLSIVKYARQRYKEEKNAGSPFDKVYCVFDKDEHASYSNALAMIDQAQPKKTFFCVNSVPSFEFWILIHFVKTTKPYHRSGNKTAARNLLSDLKKFIPNYDKSSNGVFGLLLERMSFAVKNAEHALHEAHNSGTDNPTTRVHELIEHMKYIKNKI